MFASAAKSVKINAWPQDFLDEKTEFLPNAAGEITHLSWSNDNTYMAILQQNEKPQILSTRNLENIRVVHNVVAPNVSSIVFKNNTKRNLAMGTKYGDVVIYDTKSREITKCYGKLVNSIEHIEFSFDDLQLGVLCQDTAVIFDSESDGEINTEYKHADKCSSLKFHPTILNRLAVGCENGVVSLWDTRIAAKILNSQLHSQIITGLKLSRCGNYLISSGRDYKLCITDLNTGECQFRLNLSMPISSIDLSYDDKTVAVGLDDGSISLYDLNFTVQPLTTIRPHASSISKLVFANGVQNTETESLITTIVLKNNTAHNSKQSKTEVGDKHMENLEKLRCELVKLMKQQTEDLEKHIKAQCQKFRVFINNEFKTINESIKDRWELFNCHDANEILEKINEGSSDFVEDK